MEPLKPQHKRQILEASPAATPQEIAEYEKLLAERFTVDPDLPRGPESLDLRQRKTDRLKELRRKLFPEAEADADAHEEGMTR
jgi:hypothetical protein